MKKASIDGFSRNEELYRDFSNRLADSLWVVDANTLKVLFISDMTHGFRGYSVEEVIGSNLKEIITDDSYTMVLMELTKARREYEMGENPAPRLEVECFNKYDATTWIEIVAKFVQEEGVPLQIVGIARDISDRKIDEMNKGHLLKMYMEALTEETRLRSDISLLEKLLPICGGCRQIRDGQNKWWAIEAYVREEKDSGFAGILCPECLKTSCYRE